MAKLKARMQLAKLNLTYKEGLWGFFLNHYNTRVSPACQYCQYTTFR